MVVDKPLEGLTPQLYSPAGLDLKLVQAGPEDALKP